MAIRTVGVVGTGVIGASWTGLFLAHGLRVLVADPGPDAEERLASHLKSMWPALQQMGLSPGASLDNYEFVGASLGENYSKVDFVQENAPERPDVKSKLLAEIDEKTRPDVVIASSSSGIPSSKFVHQCKHPERVLIGHPFNPPHLMPLVEVVPHPGTNDTSINTALQFYNSLGRKAIHIRQETPGFVANRLQAALCNEAYSLVARGIVTAQELDACVTTSLGPRWAIVGPFMANAMGGGGGSDGFRHLLEHLGPATETWTKDMQQNAFSWTPGNIDKLTTSVNDELSGKNVSALEQQRDKQLVQLFKIKGERRASVSSLDVGPI